MPLRLLSIDGGGLRVIVAARILVELESKLQSASGNPTARIADHFDLVAGTSGGGILACFLLCPDPADPARPRFSASQALDLVFLRGPEFFHAPLGHRIRTLGGVTDEKYPADGLEAVLLEVFEDLMLSELLRPCLFPAYDIQRRKAHFFKQHRAVTEQARDFRVRDLARATSAAPTYFECARISSADGSVHALVDGGLVANNPAMCGYAEAREAFGKSAADMLVLSVGSGTYKKAYSYYNAKDWGLLEWARPALDIFMTGVAETVDYQLEQIFASAGRSDAYLRVQTALASEQADLDNAEPDNLQKLLQDGADTAATYDAKLSALAQTLVSS